MDMNKELLDDLVSLKIDAKALTLLVDTILDSCRIAYGGDGLRIDEDAPILTVVKAFRPDEYNNRYEQLKSEYETLLKTAREES